VIRFLKHPRTPILLLLAINLAGGFLTYQHYGMSWDEPLFYNYADSIRGAYTPQAFAPGFDFYQVFGKSPEDHKIYGPAYLLLAWPVQRLAMLFPGADMASAWHLVNFITFQLGLIAFYCLARRWLDTCPAGAATAFFAWQPVFWGHAFINPKDAPFMVFFLSALVLGLRFVDSLAEHGKIAWARLISASLMLGLASAIRVIGPLAGAIIFIYFVFLKKWRGFPLFIAYGVIAAVTMFVFWPYLWADPLNRLLEVLKHMANNPTELAVVFDGQIFRANEMPRRYLPQMLGLTLTEPTWPLFVFGLLAAGHSIWTKKWNWRAPVLVIGLFLFMLAYVVNNQPAVYDGFRHFLFITPPIFIAIGFGFQWLWEKIKHTLWWLMVVLMLLPGLLGILQMHPYEYAYYNLASGGVGKAFRVYETEYWLTCYKEALEWTRANAPDSTLHVQREIGLAKYYAGTLTLKNLDKESEDQVLPGDLLLLHSRANLDLRSIYRKYPVIHTIGRDGAQFCIIKSRE